FAAGSHDARYSGNEQTTADRAMVRRVLGAEVTRSKIWNACNAVPNQALEGTFDRMKAVIFRHRFGRNCRYVYRDADFFLLEPSGGERVIAIRPLLGAPIVLILQPWRRLQLHGHERELIVSEHSLPLRRLSQRYQGVGEDWLRRVLC